MARSIICFGEDWNRHPGSAQDIMERLSDSHMILWVDSLGLRRPHFSLEDFKRIIQKIRNWLKGTKSGKESVIVFTPLVLPFYGSKLARFLNSIILKLSIKSVMKKHAMVDPILWISCPAAEGVVGGLGECKSVYYCADEHSVFPGLSKEVVSLLEDSLFRKVDLVIATSKNLFDRKSAKHSNIHFIPHGVDFQHFSKAACSKTVVPLDISEISKPIIGFYGLIQDLIDFDLVGSIAEARPDWSIVMIGPKIFDVSVLPTFPNLHFMGGRTREELPNYVKAFDVCMIPYKLVDRTIYANPNKLRQYLASGKPIVSTPLPEVIKYRELVRIAHSPEEFVREIQSVLESDSEEEREKRMKSVEGESMEHIVDRIQQIL